MKYAKKISLLLCCAVFVLCLSVPVVATTYLVDYYFKDIPRLGGTQSAITSSTRSEKVTTSVVGTFKGQTGSWLRPYAHLVNSNGVERCDYVQINSNNVIYYSALRNTELHYYYYPEVKSYALEPNKTGLELWYSSDEVR